MVLIKRKRVSHKIHKLVVTHFITDQLPKNFEICHRDGNKLNNHFTNLYVGNNESNVLDRYRHGSTKLSISDTLNIKRLLKESDLSHKEIATKFNVKTNCISRINSGSKVKVYQ